jgi:hypothetical protein
VDQNEPSCLAYSQRGQTCGEVPTKTGQPQSLQLTTGSPSMPRTIVPQRLPPQGPVPTPVRLLTCSKVLAPAWMALSTVPLRILLHKQAGLRFSMTACSLAFRSSSSMTKSFLYAKFIFNLAQIFAKLITWRR